MLNFGGFVKDFGMGFSKMLGGGFCKDQFFGGWDARSHVPYEATLFYAYGRRKT